MKKNYYRFGLIFGVYLVLLVLLIGPTQPVFVRAKLNTQSGLNEQNNEILLSSKQEENIILTYSILDEAGNVIDEKDNVQIGDLFVLSNLKSYEIKSINNENKTAVAEYLGCFNAPNIAFSSNIKLVSSNQNKTVGLYMSHNDESYIDGDGVDSVFGEGGIHDITNHLASNLSHLGVNAIVDETLHLPHDSGAYTRSKTTAQELLNDNLGFIFDIHRDGAPKSAFITNCGGKECCQIRIVVGQNNENQEENFTLASNIFAVGNKLYPNLFKDIYFGKGSYNQNLSKNALLFEMGSHEVPKNLVLQAVPKLAEVLNKTLFESSTNHNGDLIVYKHNNKNTNKPNLLNNKTIKNNNINADNLSYKNDFNTTNYLQNPSTKIINKKHIKKETF